LRVRSPAEVKSSDWGWEGRWSLAQILRATLLGLMAGCRSLSKMEQLTDSLAPAMRRRLGLPRRLAGTTARDALCRVPLDGLRAVLHRVTRAAWRRAALEPAGLPADERRRARRQGHGAAYAQPPLVQNRVEGQVVPFGIVRTVTCSLVSAAGRPCIEAIPIPGDTNEVGQRVCPGRE
jgi:hypothetical protein